MALCSLRLLLGTLPARAVEDRPCHAQWNAQCMSTIRIAVRLRSELVEQLDRLVPAPHASRSEALRRAVELYLYRLAAEHDAAVYDRMPLTESELSFADDPEAWDLTPQW